MTGDRECSECGSTENVDEHHTSYEPEETVMLCRSCHWKVHKSDEHPLKPDDSSDTTTIVLEKETRDKLREERLPHESNYGDTLARLLGVDEVPYITESEAKSLISDMVVLEALE